ncbi:MAG: hypothetical protein BGO26_09195 [Actinobacteria bacterium 69-20]|nr:MAG: hypothetical protein BGO26_09195 [Actinobacteria bacterium 69-20]
MVTERPKNPVTPPRPLIRDDRDLLLAQPTLWRIHGTFGPHALAWNEFRTFGPLSTARFDPHPQPRGEHDGYGVSYAALDLPTAVAEVFQHTRVVESTPAVTVTSWSPVRPLRLLDLTGDWALRNGASHSLQAAPRRTCRNWSRTILETWQDVDGLQSASTMTGRPIVTLYERAADSYPHQPAFSRPLNTTAVWVLVADAAAAVGYRTI